MDGQIQTVLSSARIATETFKMLQRELRLTDSLTPLLEPPACFHGNATVELRAVRRMAG